TERHGTDVRVSPPRTSLCLCPLPRVDDTEQLPNQLSLSYHREEEIERHYVILASSCDPPLGWRLCDRRDRRSPRSLRPGSGRNEAQCRRWSDRQFFRPNFRSRVTRVTSSPTGGRYHERWPVLAIDRRTMDRVLHETTLTFVGFRWHHRVSRWL